MYVDAKLFLHFHDRGLARDLANFAAVNGDEHIVNGDIAAAIDEVMEQRLPNPFMPDAPQRIATDTSQKVGIRFGEKYSEYEILSIVEHAAKQDAADLYRALP